MTTLDEIRQKLKAMMPRLQNSFKVNEIGVFGSAARGEQHQKSDIDLLVDMNEDADLIDIIALSQHLEEELDNKVDIIPRRSIRPELRDNILSEVRYI